MAETLEQKRARANRLTPAQRQAILKNFKLSSAQQQQLRALNPDRADAQMKRWQDQYVMDNLPAAPVTSGTKPAGATPTATTPAAATPPDWEKAAMELYGGYYAIVQSVPELKDLLLLATQQGWSDAEFEYKLRQTTWWKTTTESARQWDIASQVDPASAQTQIDNRVAQLRGIAQSQFGVSLSDTTLAKIAKDSLRGGWNDALISNAIGLESTKTEGGMSQLASGFVGQSLRQTANDYGLKLSDSTMNQWIAGIATGQTSRDTFKQYAIQTAKNLFPSISQQLDNGMTFQQIVDPYRNTASNLLEISPDSIDFTDPKWANAISFVDGKGNQRMMSFSEWANYLRNDRLFGYEYTSDAQKKAYEVANNLANLFGRV